MIENVLSAKNVKTSVKISIKTAISLAIIVLAAALPQIVHAAAGAQGGAQWLPMYLPVLLGGCLLGAWWGLAVGVASPLVSFAVTSFFGEAMPAASRLPFMVAELAVFAFVSGLFSRHIVNNKWLAFVAVIAAQVSGRALFLLSAVIFESVAPFTAAMVWAQLQTGLAGMLVQAVAVPLIVILCAGLIEKNKE